MRGHREQGDSHFRALIHFRIDAGEWIREQVLQEVRYARYFSECADEAADCSNKEQLLLVIHFVYATGSIREEFVDFVLCNTGTRGNAIAEKIMVALGAYGLDINSLWGQGYDGAGNMAGKYIGAAMII